MANSNKIDGWRVYLRLLNQIKPYIYFLILSSIGFSAFAFTQAAYARILQYFVEALDGKWPTITHDFGFFLPSSLICSAAAIPTLLFVITILRGLGLYIGNYCMGKVANHVIHNLRCKLFNQLIKLPIRFLDNQNSGYLLSRITYNVNRVALAITDAFKIAFREGLTVVFLILYLLMTNWKFSLLLLVMFPVLIIVIKFASQRVRRLSTNIQNSMGDLTHVSSETIKGYRIMRGFGGEEYEQKKFINASKKNIQRELKLLQTSSLHTPITQFIVNIVLGILFFLVLIYKDGSSTASLVGFITAAALLPKPIRQLSEVNINIQNGIAAANDIFNLIDEKTEIDLGTYSPKNIVGRIIFKNVYFSYSSTSQVALNNINIIIEPGQTVAIVGKSGSGKTTLANLLPRFYDYSKGDIILDQYSIKEYKLSNLRSHISIVDQNIILFNDTIKNNIAYGELKNYSDASIKEAAKLAYANSFIENLDQGFDTIIGENGIVLSGGQKQRLALARAILKNAPVLILDEATSSLDNESESYIKSAIKEVSKNKTTIIIAHRLSTIENADLLIVLDQGKIVESGKHEELLNKKKYYYELYHSQYKLNSHLP